MEEVLKIQAHVALAVCRRTVFGIWERRPGVGCLGSASLNHINMLFNSINWKISESEPLEVRKYVHMYICIHILVVAILH